MNLAAQQPPASPDYAGLVRFLIEPFLESPASLRVDCEIHPRQARTWIRLAFDDPDKGRVYGRGSRNIHAIRLVLDAVARVAGQSVYLEIYDREAGDMRSGMFRGDGPSRSPRDRDRGGRREMSGRPPREPSRREPPRFRPPGKTDRY